MTNLAPFWARPFQRRVQKPVASQDDLIAAVAALVANSPIALDTLSELASALGNDPQFATTVMNLIGTKLTQTQVDARVVAGTAAAGRSGAYADLTGKPPLFSGAYSELTGKPSLFSGGYADLTGKPTLGTAAAKNTTDFVAVGDTAWTMLTLGNSYTTDPANGAAPARYRKFGSGLAILEGVVSAPSNASASQIIATLPAGYRPAKLQLFPGFKADAFTALQINPNGDIIYRAGTPSTYFSLSGMIWLAEQ